MTKQTLTFKMWFRQFESYWDSASQLKDTIIETSFPQLKDLKKQREYAKYYAEHNGAYKYEETQ